MAATALFRNRFTRNSLEWIFFRYLGLRYLCAGHDFKAWIEVVKPPESGPLFKL
jgi:hypothetical protein